MLGTEISNFRSGSSHRGLGIGETSLESSFILVDYQGIARTQSPTIKNNAPEFLTFGEIASLQRHRGAMVGLHLSGPP